MRTMTGYNSVRGAMFSMAFLWAAFAGPARAQNWQLVWSDEFSGTQGTLPDQTKWGYDAPYAGSGNQEQETYCGLAGTAGVTGICANWQQNAQMDGQGHLVISAINSGTAAAPVWTSARLLTQDKFSFSYGRAEASIKLPSGKGVWPAFWMLGNNIRTVGWPTCGEIDIMENVLSLGLKTTQSTVHGPGYSGASGIWHQYSFPNSQEIDTAYHTYGMIWSQNLIQFYVDDYTAPFASVSPSNLPASTNWVFNQPFFLLLNLAVGGSWPGPTDATTPNPALMYVDYVRVYSSTAVPPELVISKSHTGSFTQGQTGATYTVTVSDVAAAAATSGAVTVTDTIPTYLTLVSMAGTGWNCASNTCTRSDPLLNGSSYPPITVTVSVAANAPSQVTNRVSVSGGGAALPSSATDPTTILAAPPPPPAPRSPANGADGVAVTPTLIWDPTIGATSYNVHFGAQSPPPVVANTKATAYAPGALSPETLYYWQVAAVNSAGITPSAIWSFTTGAPDGALRFVPVTPCRVADTRNPEGLFGGPALADGSTRDFPIPQSACAIPDTAQAYSLNVTVVPAGPLAFLTLWPSGQDQANVSTLNSWNGSVVANAAIVPAGLDGAVSVFVPNATDLILDINGYFDLPSVPNSYSFYPATPCRVADTRGPVGTFGGPQMSAAQTRDFPIPASLCNIPATAKAYSLNVTVVPDAVVQYLGFLSMWPSGLEQANVSTLNSWTGKVVANAALVPAGTNGSISVYVSNPTDVILDINGYFGQPRLPGALYFYPVTPCRIADTRNPADPFGGPEMAAQETRSFAIPASACSIPATAAAYSLNVTVVPDGPLYLPVGLAGGSGPAGGLDPELLGWLGGGQRGHRSGGDGRCDQPVRNKPDPRDSGHQRVFRAVERPSAPVPLSATVCAGRTELP